MKRGSALLIVLGMLAFMVISAVAFSAFMRNSRLPSSYLRRASASRHLVKAALAEAVDLIDISIGDDPYPGMGYDGAFYKYPRHSEKNSPAVSARRNFWRDRCFIGSETCQSTDDTVSTMCLEGLAYLPPALINEARYWSRRSAAAVWHTFGFDSGRYAFSAIDVTDCLDVNKLMADKGRDSSDGGRIKLAYAFEDERHSRFNVAPSDWDEFMKDYRDATGRPTKSKVPFTSIADYNLAVQQNGPSGLFSPFCRFIENGIDFVTEETGDNAELGRHMLFVTDTWFPQTNQVGKAKNSIIDITSGGNQPFYGFTKDTMDKNDVTVDQLMQQTSKFLDRYENELSPPEVVALYDYLDFDSVPTSLALPTVERTPMVTGVSLEGALNVAVTPTPAYQTVGPTPTQAGQVQYVVEPFTLALKGSLTVMVGSVFPFKYKRDNKFAEKAPYRAQAFATVTFVRGNTSNLRPGAQTWAMTPSWSGGSEGSAQLGTFDNAQGKPSGIWIRSAPKELPLPAKVEEEEDAVLTDLLLQLKIDKTELASKLTPQQQGINDDNCTFRYIRRQRASVNPATGTLQWNDDNGDGYPLKEFGAVPSNDTLSGPELSPADNSEYVPVVQVWVRITNSDGKAVDMVPASVADDEQPSQFLTDCQGSAARGALRFGDRAGAAKVTFTGTALTGAGDMDTSPKAYLIDDPRFNYAPENFWATDDLTGEFKQEWLEKNRATQRDGDIFMSTSDAGYLQSPYELAFLLRITGLNGGSDWGCLTGGRYNGTAAKSLGDAPADGAMWRTYTQFDCENRRDYISDLDMRTGSKGFRMTPYASSAEAMMAVFANTPLDWWSSSTNDLKSVGGKGAHDSGDSWRPYTFSKHSGAQAQVEFKDMRELAEWVRNNFRSQANAHRPWEDVWDNLNWRSSGGELEKLFGVDLKVPLHSVDRKFLHGYWRECFSNRQQLFLIFLRAEPLMMGGGTVGQTPPQLGARAVALVWRDPAPTGELNGDKVPHRTRVLFYRQFD